MSSRATFRICFLVALVAGAGAALFYAAQDLTLSHYDAKAHLVVARRIIDSLRPGWWQIGAVWLPLPHLIQAIPVQVDAFYRTGLFGVALSVVCFATAAASVGWLVHRATGSIAGAAAGLVVFASQPDVLYLQSTPMTEPLLMALTLGAVVTVWDWTARGATGSVLLPGWLLALACLTRYEAWPIAAAAVGASWAALVWQGRRPLEVLPAILRLALFPVAAGLAFLVLSRATVGEWLVTGGFYVVDNADYHRPFKPLGSVWWGLLKLNGPYTVGLGVAGLVVLAVAMIRERAHRPLLVTLALAGCAALPYYAFYSGHPFRIRYMVVLTMMLAAATGLGVGLLPRTRLRALAAVIVAAAALRETPPLSSTAPMVLEAQWDRPRSVERRAVTKCLVDGRDGRPILASMGSLAHYMQETSHAGFALRDYIHEGIGQIWTDSLEHAGRHAGWVLIEEQAEGGDVLFQRNAASPAFLAGFARVCEGGGVALYRKGSGLRAQGSGKMPRAEP